MSNIAMHSIERGVCTDSGAAAYVKGKRTRHECAWMDEGRRQPALIRYPPVSNRGGRIKITKRKKCQKDC